MSVPPREQWSTSPTWATNKNAATLALLSQMTLIVAIFLPFMTILRIGREETYSIAGGVVQMFADGHLFLAAVILSFSIIFPILKNCLLLVSTSALVDMSPARRRQLNKLTGKLGKYSMLDVFVAALLIMVFKMEGMIEAKIGVGTLLFCAAILMSMLASACIPIESQKHE